MPLRQHAKSLETLYGVYNRREYVHPDPLECLYGYQDPCDREVVGLIASSLAYGRVRQILASVKWVLDRLGPQPARTLADRRPSQLAATVADFRHRFQTGLEMAALLAGMRSMIRRHGSLGRGFLAAVEPADPTVQPALGRWVGELAAAGEGRCGHLLPDPAKGSACKRLHLYLRWMVRSDDVDPGGWEGVRAARLIVPLDTHMHHLARELGATARAAADLRTAEEITAAFRKLSPDDPVKYDFALTRLGIHPDTDMGAFLAECGRQVVKNA